MLMATVQLLLPPLVLRATMCGVLVSSAPVVPFGANPPSVGRSASMAVALRLDALFILERNNEEGCCTANGC